jgi:hypothetical protein
MCNPLALSYLHAPAPLHMKEPAKNDIGASNHKGIVDRGLNCGYLIHTGIEVSNYLFCIEHSNHRDIGVEGIA